MDAQQVAHLWAARGFGQESNSTGSFYYKDDTIYSYGLHFVAGKLYDNGETGSDFRRFALVNSEGYSNTTAKHLHYVRSALVGRMCYFNVPKPEAGFCEENESYLLDDVALQIEHALNPRMLDCDIHQVIDCIEELNSFYSLFGQWKTFSLDEITYEMLWDITHEKRHKRDVKKAREAETRYLKEKNNAEKQAQDLSDWVQHLNNRSFYNLDYDRVRVTLVDKLELETTRGAKVPIDHAIRAFVLANEGFKITGEKVGAFEIETEPKDDIVKIGCHRVNLTQVREALVAGGFGDQI